MGSIDLAVVGGQHAVPLHLAQQILSEHNNLLRAELYPMGSNDTNQLRLHFYSFELATTNKLYF